MQDKKIKGLIDVCKQVIQVNATVVDLLENTLESNVEATNEAQQRQELKTKARAIRDTVAEVIGAPASASDPIPAPQASATAPRKAGKAKAVPLNRAKASKPRGGARTGGKEPTETLKAALYESLKRRTAGVGAKELCEELGITERRDFLKLANWGKEAGVLRVEGSRRGTVYSLLEAPSNDVAKTRKSVHASANGLMVA